MGKRELVTEQPRYIKLNERDNVAIVVNDFGLPAGSRFACGLELRAFVPQGHKTALVDIAEVRRSCAMARSSAMLPPLFLRANGSTKRASRFPILPRSTGSKPQPPCPSRSRRWKTIRSKA